MSKVVHLSDAAHQRAKDFCKDRGLRMSDWVAGLIEATIDGSVPVVAAKPGVAAVPKRKDLRRLEEEKNEEVESVFSAPPFWARRASGR
jgi:hypothetical protein